MDSSHQFSSYASPWKKKVYLCQQTFIWKKIEEDFVITGTAPISVHFAWISVFGTAASDTLKHTSSNLTKPLPQSASKKLETILQFNRTECASHFYTAGIGRISCGAKNAEKCWAMLGMLSNARNTKQC